MHRLWLSGVLLLGAGAALADRREAGNLVTEDVPEIPRRLVERTTQYANTRGATLLDFDVDNAGILVATRFGETAQVHHVAGPGMDRQQWTFFPEPVTSAAYDVAEASKGFFFRLDTGGSEFYQYLWFDRATGRHALLTDGKSRHEGWLPSPRGGKAAFSGTARNKTDFDLHVIARAPTGWADSAANVKRVKEVKGQWNAVDWSDGEDKLLLSNYVSANEGYLHVLNLADGKTTEINPQDGKKKIAYGPAIFSQGGKGVYYASDEDAEFLRLVHLDLATGKKEVLTPQIPWDITQVARSLDGKWLCWVANEGGSSAVYLAPAASVKNAVKLDTPRGVVGGLQFDRAGKRLGFTLSTPQSSSDVFVADVETRVVTRWTFSEVGGLPTQSFVVPELLEFPSFDKRKISAWVYRPREVKKPVPVIILIHGGPEAQAQVNFEPTVQYWVKELGAAVLVPNVRGSRGYGKTFLTLDDGNKRQDTVKDVGALLDWVGTQADLDKTRVAVYGGSYGGYMVLATMFTYPERIRCGIDVVGISNFVTFLEHTEDYRRDLRRAEYGDERDPAMRAFLDSISPTTNARKIKSPLFVVQGLNDPRVPASEAEQMVKTVRGNGGTVWYLLARDEGHGFQKKRNRDTLMQSATLFWETHLLN
jgi:dipeptidyl aminopeptidase/acylaminoacyl peptidase